MLKRGELKGAGEIFSGITAVYRVRQIHAFPA
jgi:hypothetical protein